MSKVTRIYSVANRKGGVGKSTVTVLLAAALTKERRKKCIILDTDEQRSVSALFDAEKMVWPDTRPLVEVLPLDPGDVAHFLASQGQHYDLVFIDPPRITESRTTSAAARLLALCDGILIPVLGSSVDAMSTRDFWRLVSHLVEQRQDAGAPLQVAGFINRWTTRTDNQHAEIYLQSAGLRMMENPLNDLKIFQSPSLFHSIMDTADGRRRFGYFFGEFCRIFKIK